MSMARGSDAPQGASPWTDELITRHHKESAETSTPYTCGTRQVLELIEHAKKMERKYRALLACIIKVSDAISANNDGRIFGDLDMANQCADPVSNIEEYIRTLEER